MAVMLSDLLRNLTFNRSAHCTQASDQCPLGLLFYIYKANLKRVCSELKLFMEFHCDFKRIERPMEMSRSLLSSKENMFGHDKELSMVTNKTCET